MIEVNELSFAYPHEGTKAIEDVSFTVGQGEVFGFLGPSGAGKSTTLGVLVGLLRGWQGQVSVDGRSPGEWGAEYYRRIGVSFEFPNHYSKLTARENLEFFRALHGEATKSIDGVLGMVALEDHADRPVGEFSKGMKMRLNFARSLLHDPDLWFLDEPTTGLDPVNALRVRDLIRARRNAGTTTVVATHDMNTAAAVCDRVAFIVDGGIAAIGAPAALRRAHGRRQIEVRWTDDRGVAGAEIFPMDGVGDDPRFLELLRSPGLESVHSLEASLEDVFVQVTGRTLV
ncbi:MAG: ABC transporter ATP-binding protein [Gemmatimonadota bacterium]|nr:ABC transporter ATP-binding protein [Gemmatimonadota bacterium]